MTGQPRDPYVCLFAKSSNFVWLQPLPTMMHYWQEVLKVMEITGRNPSSRIKDSQIRGRSPSIWEFFFLLRGLRSVIPNYL